MAKFDCIADFEDLTPAEEKLIAAWRAERKCRIGEDRPTAATPENTIRATLLRVLITGESATSELSNYGIRLTGAWITDHLKLNFSISNAPICLEKCYFLKSPHMQMAQFVFLSLSGSRVPGLSASKLHVKTTLKLNDLVSTKTVDLMGAEVGEQLQCTSATLTAEKNDHSRKPSLNAQGMKVGGAVFLDNISANGLVDLNNAYIEGSLTCEGSLFSYKNEPASFNDGVKKSENENDTNRRNCKESKINKAFHAENLTVKKTFFWLRVKKIDGFVNLINARIGDFNDDIASSPKDLYLDGFTYDQIANGKITAQERLPWLANGSNHDGIFYPQPYTQLAKVLFAMGHDREAKKILMERENRLSTVALQNLRTKPNGGTYLMFENPLIDAQVCGAKAWFWTIGLLAGHGYAPFRALGAMLALIAVTTFLAYQAWSTGAFAPNSDVIVTSKAWQVAMMKDCVPTPFPGCEPNPALTWSNDRAQGIDWASFNALAYAADLALPVVELGQTSAWAPSKDRGVWGETLWWASWWIELLGWLFTVLGGAAITGLIQRSRE